MSIKIVSWRLIVLMIVMMGAAAVWFAAEAAAFSGAGSGTSEDPYRITSRDELDEIRNELGAHYRLEADLDLTGINWTPIGQVGSFFTGSFDGNGYTISNLTLNTTGNNQGLFGRTLDALIRNVGLIDVNIIGTGGSDNVGGLVGYLDTSTVEYSYVTGTVSASGDAGGLIGYSIAANGSKSIIRNSYAVATVTSGSSNAGGLIGFIEVNTDTFASYYAQNLTGTSAAGIGLDAADMRHANGFSNWSFGENEPWAIVEGVTYPIQRVAYERLLLDGLTVTSGGEPVALTPNFASRTLSYSTADMLADVEELTIMASPRSVTSAVYIGGDAGESKVVPLALGLNTIVVEVSTDLALPGTTTRPLVFEYQLSVIRQDGSVTHPHHISTSDQLAAIGTGFYGMGHQYSLLNDIDLAGVDWEPIGGSGTPFNGLFNGNYKVIRNLTVNKAGSADVGLFASNTGTIQAIGLENVNIVGGDRTGGLVGSNAGNLTNVYVQGAVTGGSGVGGIAGLNDAGGDVSFAYAAGTAAGDADVGGLVGLGSSAIVSDAYWDAETSGLADSGGGAAMTTEQMRTKATYAGWDFANVWAMMDGTTYPMWKAQFDAVKLNAVAADPPEGVAVWTPTAYTPDNGNYTITLDRYVESVNIAATSSDPAASVTIAGSAAATVPVTPGDNVIEVAVTGADGYASGRYVLTVQVPTPSAAHVQVPTDGDYAAGDSLAFVVEYEGEVSVSGSPRLALTVGADTVYAEYAGQPAGEGNKLIFEYTVETGLADTDGIEAANAIETPGGANITASGESVALTLPAFDPSGVRIDAIVPAIVLTQSPEASVWTTDPVTVTVAVTDAESGVAAVKWAVGSQTKSYFTTGGTALAASSFEAPSNGTYTVYAIDAAGNAATAELTIANIGRPPSSSPSGSSESQPCVDGSCLYLRAGEAGEFTVGGMTVVIPAGATDEAIELTISELSAEDLPMTVEGVEPLSAVYELLKSNAKPFLKPVTLRIAFHPEEAEGRTVAVHYYDEEAKRWVYIGGTVDGGETIAAEVDHFTKFAVLAVSQTELEPEPAVSLTDIESHWAKAYIVEAVNSGIINGYPDQTFRPNERVTRAEFAVMLSNAFDWTTPELSELKFSDAEEVPVWAQSAMNAAVLFNVLSGYPDGTLRPNDPVNHSETAALIVRVLSLPIPEVSSTAYHDDPLIPVWAKPFADSAARAGVMQGDDRGSFRPAASTTRAEAVVVILRALEAIRVMYSSSYPAA